MVLLVVSPQTNNFDRLLFFDHLINQAVMDIDSAGIGSFEIADKPLVRRRILERILFQHIQKPVHLRPETGLVDFKRVFSGLTRPIKLPGYQGLVLEERDKGSLRPLWIDSRIPGMDIRYNVS